MSSGLQRLSRTFQNQMLTCQLTLSYSLSIFSLLKSAYQSSLKNVRVYFFGARSGLEGSFCGACALYACSQLLLLCLGAPELSRPFQPRGAVRQGP